MLEKGKNFNGQLQSEEMSQHEYWSWYRSDYQNQILFYDLPTVEV